MTDIRITDEDYTHNRAGTEESMDVALAGIIALVGEALQEVNDAISEKCKEPMYKFHDEISVDGMLIYWAGEPTGIVQYLDNTPTYIPFKASRTDKTEDSEVVE